MTVETTTRARTDPAVRAWSWVTGISPSVVHYAGLVVAVPILGYLARDQWFFYDEWDFLVPSNGRALLTEEQHILGNQQRLGVTLQLKMHARIRAGKKPAV